MTKRVIKIHIVNGVVLWVEGLPDDSVVEVHRGVPGGVQVSTLVNMPPPKEAP